MKAWTARNPLGVIALFISLIYGMSALLLGTTVQTLTASNQTSLVWFVILFPVAVLAAFVWLVSRHHHKLYSPGDFRSDDAFWRRAPPETLGARIADQAQDLAEDLGTAAPGSPKALPARRGAGRRDTPLGAAEAYLMEGLAFRELGERYEGVIRQHVQIPGRDGRSVHLDGLIEGRVGVYIVEIKILTGREYARRIRECINQLNRAFIEGAALPNGRTIGLLVLILDGDLTEDEVRRSVAASDLHATLEITPVIFQADDLLRKYGFSGSAQA